jgi:DNA-directed RNA polymerase specialized sigma24 family protein
MIEAPSIDPLNLLLRRVAAGDRAAFRRLYAFLAMRVWRDAARALPNPADARAVTRATFVEVWQLAGHHLDQEWVDIRAWIAAITARRAEDRLRRPDGRSPLAGAYDRHVHCELIAALGAGHATIRTGPATFARVEDLNGDLSARAGSTW